MLNYQKAYPKYDCFVDHAQQIVHVDESELKKSHIPLASSHPYRWLRLGEHVPRWYDDHGNMSISTYRIWAVKAGNPKTEDTRIKNAQCADMTNWFIDL